MSTISFIIPAHNAELTLKKCIDSIVHQEISGCDKEIIVINNNSSDRTHDIASSFPTVKIHFLKEQSRAKARQLGISMSNGEFIAFIDSDVVLNKSWASILLHHLKERNYLGAVQGSIIPQISSPWHWIRWHRSRVRTYGTFIHLSATTTGSIPVINTAASIWRRLSLGSGFDPCLNRAEDIDLTLTIMNQGYSLLGTSSATATVEWSSGILKWFMRFYDQGKFEKVVYAKWGFPRQIVNLHHIFSHPLWYSMPLYAQVSDLVTSALYKIGSKSVVKNLTVSPDEPQTVNQALYKTFENDLFIIAEDCRSISVDEKIGIFNLKSKRCFWVESNEKKWHPNLATMLVRNRFIVRRE